MSGFVLLHRSLLGHPAFRNESETMAFAWMIARASWQPTRVRYKGRAVQLNRGELCISQRDMADAFGRDKAWIERLWKRLVSEAMIEARREAAAAVITICNYDRYQAASHDREAANEASDWGTFEADAGQTRGTEQIREQGNKCSVDKSTEHTRAKSAKKPEGVSDAVWSDFQRLRRERRAPLSETALAGIESQATIAGWTLERALRECCERGWQGFKAEWVNGGGRNGNGRNANGSGSGDGFFDAAVRMGIGDDFG